MHGDRVQLSNMTDQVVDFDGDGDIDERERRQCELLEGRRAVLKEYSEKHKAWYVVLSDDLTDKQRAAKAAEKK